MSLRTENVLLVMVMLICGSASADIVANDRSLIVAAITGLTAFVAFVSFVSHRE